MGDSLLDESAAYFAPVGIGMDSLGGVIPASAWETRNVRHASLAVNDRPRGSSYFGIWGLIAVAKAGMAAITG